MLKSILPDLIDGQHGREPVGRGVLNGRTAVPSTKPVVSVVFQTGLAQLPFRESIWLLDPDTEH